jgi:predicted MPP superfamily phosphohydrolase
MVHRHPAALLTGSLFLGLGAYTTLVEPYRPVLRRTVVQVPEDWPRLSILHLSDLHVHAEADRLYRVQERFLQSIPDRPDLVCVTGDLCETIQGAPRAAALLGALQPSIGTLVTLGNHEHDAPIPRRHRTPLWRVLRAAELALWRIMGPDERSTGTAESRAIVEVFRGAGLTVLLNEGMRLEIDRRSLWVAGIDSTWSGQSRARQSVAGRRPDEPCLALIHEPEGVFPFIRHGAALILAGHTHGGQVRIPRFGPIYSHRTDRRIGHFAGLQRFGSAQLHVSAGLGQNISLRFNCPPEAVWIECVPTMPVQERHAEHQRPIARV